MLKESPTALYRAFSRKTSFESIFTSFPTYCLKKTVRLRPQKSFFVFERFIGSNEERVEKDAFGKNDLLYPEKTVTIFTCDEIYDRWRKYRSYRKIPKSGVFAKISYIDTLNEKSSKPPKTVLCIHGIPGNYGVFSHLINALSRDGFRVIVPTFPGSLHLPGKYGSELFRHTVEEKTQVFKDFLKEINVSEIDCIVAHSSAIYPALPLVLDPDLKVKCQVFFNTGGHKKPITMKHYRTIWICSQLYLTSWGKLFIQKTGRFIMKHILRTPIRDDNIDGILLLAITMIYSQYWKTKDMFLELSRKQTPTLYCFSEDDKVVERKLSYEVVSLLGASRENIDYFNEKAELIMKGNSLHWLKLMSFKEGSHYVFRKHPHICNKNVIELIKKI